jgi:hypothetical protein
MAGAESKTLKEMGRSLEDGFCSEANRITIEEEEKVDFSVAKRAI